MEALGIGSIPSRRFEIHAKVHHFHANAISGESHRCARRSANHIFFPCHGRLEAKLARGLDMANVEKLGERVTPAPRRVSLAGTPHLLLAAQTHVHHYFEVSHRSTVESSSVASESRAPHHFEQRLPACFWTQRCYYYVIGQPSQQPTDHGIEVNS